MEKGLESFSFREIVVIIFPGVYFMALTTPLMDKIGLSGLSDSVANNVSFIMLSLLLGIVLYWIDIPKKLPLFNRNLPTTKLIEAYPNVDKIKVINCYFRFYDKISDEQKKKTNTYTSLYHFCVNILILSLIIVALYLFFTPFKYGWIALSISVISFANIIGLFYGDRKIKYMFDRQFKAFQNSDISSELV